MFASPARSRQMRFAQVVACLHFGKSADGSFKLVAAFSPGIKFRRRRVRGHNQLHSPVIKLIDEPCKTANDVRLIALEPRNSREQYGVIAARELDVISLAARSVTEIAEIEPGNTSGVAPRAYHASFDLER